MPAMSVVAFPAVVARAGLGGAATYEISPEDVTVTVQEMPSGGLTVLLPGASSPVPPSDGDFYVVTDPLGLVSASSAMKVDGNGYSINGAPTLVLNVPRAWAGFQFDAVNKVWITFVGNIA